MAYITENDVSQRMGAERLANLCGGSGEISKITSGVIARAEAVIDAFASARYATPLAVTGIVAEWALSLAEYELWKRAPASKIPEKIREAYQNTVAQLADLAAGRIGTGGELEPREMNAVPSIEVSERDDLFGHDAMGSY